MDTKPLRTWNTDKQQAYRDQHADALFFWHLVLDASPSMIPHAGALIASYNRYLAYLKQTASPMSMTQTSLFAESLQHGSPCPLGYTAPLTPERYRPQDGDGTALYNALGKLCTETTIKSQHILIVFTDGEDCAQAPVWTAGKVKELLTTLQEVEGWLAIYLGAHEEALREATAMGFHPGNVLTFAAEKIPEAFQRLQDATQQYLNAGKVERKLLAQGGVFTA